MNKSVITKLNKIYDSYYTDSPIKNSFLVKAYGSYISGGFVKEGMDYFHMEAHFDLDLEVFCNGRVNINQCDKIWLIKEDNAFEEIL